MPPIMKVSPANSRSQPRESGSAVLVILVLLACIAMLLYSNSQTLHLLSQELKLIDQKQQARFGPTSPAQVPASGVKPR